MENDSSSPTNGDFYNIKINLKLRVAMDGATKNVCNIMYPNEDPKEVMGKVRGYLYKRFGEESQLHLQDIMDKLADAKSEEHGTGLTKMQIIERLGLAGAYIDFINWEAKRLSLEKEHNDSEGTTKRGSKWSVLPTQHSGW